MYFPNVTKHWHINTSKSNKYFFFKYRIVIYWNQISNEFSKMLKSEQTEQKKSCKIRDISKRTVLCLPIGQFWKKMIGLTIFFVIYDSGGFGIRIHKRSAKH